MVVIEDSGGAYAAFVVTGAGCDAANGLYAHTGKFLHEAPVFENDRRCLLSRESHTKGKTGESCFGWILGQDRKPLYAVQSADLMPPTSGWRKFHGTLPLPRFQGSNDIAGGALAAAQSWKEQGKALFAEERYGEADAQWTRALNLGDRLQDETLKVTLYSNRSEAKLRLRQWEGAFADAQAVLKWRPTHDKALLRAAVAAREMDRYNEAWDAVQQCLAAHPKHPDARQMLFELEKLLENESEALMARLKLKASIEREFTGGDADDIPKAYSAKDINSKKGFRAFLGYGNSRKPSGDAPLQSLPYHHMGLPPDQVESMDRFFQEVRDKKAEKAQKAKEEQERYDKVKVDFKERAQKDRMVGKLESLEEMLPSLKTDGAQQHPDDARTREHREGALQKAAAAAAYAGGARRAELSKGDTDEIDVFFASFVGKQAPAALADDSAPLAAERRARLDKARALLRLGGEAEQLSQQGGAGKGETELKKAREQRVSAELHRLKLVNGGEPVKLEQTPAEVHCWWLLPLEVAGSDIQVSCLQNGAALRVAVKDIVVFDQKLCHQAHPDDMTWSVEHGDLRLTLTKAKKGEGWSRLGQGSASQTLPETLPEHAAASDLVEKLRQILTGDDGNPITYEHLDSQGKELADRVQAYTKAKAANDSRKLVETEVDLHRFSYLVV